CGIGPEPRGPPDGAEPAVPPAGPGIGGRKSAGMLLGAAFPRPKASQRPSATATAAGKPPPKTSIREGSIDPSDEGEGWGGGRSRRAPSLSAGAGRATGGRRTYPVGSASG